MRVHVRCSKEKCKRRAVFDKHPDAYRVPRKCEGCGGTKFRIIKDRVKEASHVDCTCGGIVWPSSTGRYECIKHRRGAAGCRFERNGTPRDADEWTDIIAAYSCPHDGLPRWPAIYCAEATRPGYSRWHFGGQATQAAGAQEYAEVG